jgi:hypothetical protein
MRLRTRLRKAEEHATERGRVPSLITFSDGRSHAEGEEMTVEEWRARYGDQIEREREMGREIFGVNFTAPGQNGDLL